MISPFFAAFAPFCDKPLFVEILAFAVKSVALRILATVLLLLLSGMNGGCQTGGARAGGEPMIGMYVHQHWPYKHPYAARAWTLEDWRGYAGGLKQLGYNTILIWPVIETMPDPPLKSDIASLEKTGKVIEMLHRELGMRAYICLCPNIVARDAEARKAPFEKRHYYYCEDLVNPADPTALSRMMARRERLLKYLAQADGFTIIDSDPGGYPHSTIAEFVNILIEHRKMFDRLRPGIELVYWVHAGWRGWGRFYEQGKLILGKEAEYLETLNRLKEANPEPWGLANGLAYAEKLGLADRVISFNYGLIEGEPSFPMTNFTGEKTAQGAKSYAARGVMGNAQTHCVQLPNTFAFARGAQGLSITDADFVGFANDLILGQGRLIVDAWAALNGSDSEKMLALAQRLDALTDTQIVPGRLKGLLFGSPRRFVSDLAKMLRYRAALADFDRAAAPNSGEKLSFKAALKRFVEVAEDWQHTHGYENNWPDPWSHPGFRKIKSPEMDALYKLTYEVREPLPPGKTNYMQVRENFAAIETMTPRFLKAMKTALKTMKEDGN